MPVTSRNRYYDPVKGEQDETGPEEYIPGLGVAGVGAAGAGLLARQLRGRGGATMGLPASITGMPGEIAGPAALRRFAAGTPGSLGGRIIPRGGPPGGWTGSTLFPRGGPSRLAALGEIGAGAGLTEAEMAAMAAGRAVPGAAAGAGRAGVRGLPGILKASRAAIPAEGRLAAMLGVTKGAPLRSMAMPALRIAGPAAGGFMAAPFVESGLDIVDESGTLGDVGGGAAKGLGLGASAAAGLTALTGGVAAPAAPFIAGGGAILGGLHGFFTGDKNPEEQAKADFEDQMDLYDTQLGYMVEDGLIDPADVATAQQRYADLKDEGTDPIEAAEIAYGGIEQQANDPQTQLLQQMQAIQQQDRINAMEAMRFASQQVAPINATYTKMYNDLAAVRNQKMANPALPADARAIFAASTPAIDMANLQAIQAASNPMAAMMQTNPEMMSSLFGSGQHMQDQLMQLYLAQLQYGGGGGGGAGTLTDLLAAEDLGAATGVPGG